MLQRIFRYLIVPVIIFLSGVFVHLLIQNAIDTKDLIPAGTVVMLIGIVVVLTASMFILDAVDSKFTNVADKIEYINKEIDEQSSNAVTRINDQTSNIRMHVSNEVTTMGTLLNGQLSATDSRFTGQLDGITASLNGQLIANERSITSQISSIDNKLYSQLISI